MKLLWLPLLASVLHASSIIDTETVYWSGVNPSVSFRFNEDGQAFTLDGVQVTMISFGADPFPPQDPAPFVFPGLPEPPLLPQLPPELPPPPLVPPPTTPTAETPEPAWLIGAGLLLLRRWKT